MISNLASGHISGENYTLHRLLKGEKLGGKKSHNTGKEAQGLKGITGEGYFLGEKKLASY